jgi:hypothetical protein
MLKGSLPVDEMGNGLNHAKLDGVIDLQEGSPK